MPFGDVLTVAYRLLARGQLCRLHRPLTEYSFLQKLFPLVVLSLKAQNCSASRVSRLHAHLRK